MPTDISREEVQRLLVAGGQLVDVRPEMEFEYEHIEGAVNIPLKTLDSDTAPRVLERARPVIVY